MRAAMGLLLLVAAAGACAADDSVGNARSNPASSATANSRAVPDSGGTTDNGVAADGDDTPPEDDGAGVDDDRVSPDGLIVAATELWLPGSRYTSGNDWLALACDRTSCAFEPGNLTVTAEAKKASDLPIDGQRLTFARTAPIHPDILAWLHRDASLPWLHAGAVTTYGSNATGFVRPHSPGTRELSVTAAGAELSRFVPLLDRSTNEYVLQLRAQGKRQMLDKPWACGDLDTNYLLWAGDLDGDSRPDYLVSYVDHYGYAQLYLSGMAVGNDLVGPALAFHDDATSNCPNDGP